MTAIRPELPPLPERMTSLPIDHRGYPVPYFVAYVDGVPDHRIADEKKRIDCLRFKRCWVCGQQLGRFVTFVIGPMCAINRVSSDPPMHRECADWATRACPFLLRPTARRREAGLPEGAGAAAGVMIRRNPGVMLLWVTRNAKAFREGAGFLFDVGEPEETRWVSEGRPATREEVLESIESGCPAVEQMAQQEGPESVAMFVAAKQRAMAFVPRAAP